MIIICGKTIAEVERDLEMAKLAVASGMPCGIGGATIEDVEQAMATMRSMMGGNAPIDNPNYVGVPPIEDEDEDTYCPECGNALDEDGYCDNCGYPDSECEDEEEDEELPPALQSMVDMARAMGVPSEIIQSALRYAEENGIA